MFWSSDKEAKDDWHCWQSRFDRKQHHHYHHHHHHHYHQAPVGFMAKWWEKKQEMSAESKAEHHRGYCFFRNGGNKTTIESQAAKPTESKSSNETNTKLPESEIKVETPEKKGWFWN